MASENPSSNANFHLYLCKETSVNTVGIMFREGMTFGHCFKSRRFENVWKMSFNFENV